MDQPEKKLTEEQRKAAREMATNQMVQWRWQQYWDVIRSQADIIEARHLAAKAAKT